MQLLDRVRKSAFLGREFLLWLWFRSELHEGRFPLGENEEAELWLAGRVVLQSDDERAEKIICLGEDSLFREARFALAESKAITEAMVRLVIGENEWSFVLDSTWLNFKSFKTPKVVQDRSVDPEGLFYEKFSLIEQALSAMDAIYASFIKARLSPDWETEELPALKKWIQKGKPRG